MKNILRGVLAAAALLALGGGAFAQKQGGVLRVYHRDSPANLSIYEEGTISVVAPAMGIFNKTISQMKVQVVTPADRIPGAARAQAPRRHPHELGLSVAELHRGAAELGDRTELLDAGGDLRRRQALDALGAELLDIEGRKRRGVGHRSSQQLV